MKLFLVCFPSLYWYVFYDTLNSDTNTYSIWSEAAALEKIFSYILLTLKEKINSAIQYSSGQSL